ncbi:centriolar coiled-coil protein of 110 kDa isoform X1 [Acinonyx jubatus]|uniref:Centriolar coiled-coil protein of 110 kDa isoform X1 n=1 Tax=Acinonyx jubatus TaxID=32536 RepID=A0A6J1Y2G3_ACIJB|nr:centriolar coiled-coil protein of 110 kDa isoform X1 [Acinonyx jubatus]XP_026898950.2 centriolar coiled-coil protein of 110 kDa isoform X1 [Acinonyx jubatus]XP_053069355.1 centriolar coiled-coil protein of 110 kDa isoform X1 [Acinonyx jubatus]
MEEYEKFCENSLARVQQASLSTESFLPVPSENISLIRFHGVAVLSPLLTIERRKEMQQEKQKALDVETRKHVNKKKDLLARVQEILENVQVRKAPNASDFDPWETETVYSNSEERNLNVPAMFPNILPSPTEHSTLGKSEKITGILPLNNEDRFKFNGIDLARDSEEFNSLKQCDISDISPVENEASVKTPSATPQETLTSDGLLPTHEEPDPSLSKVTPDPYIMSLQNLMKKSKEYIEREQSRRSLRSSAKRSVNESHSDKENDAGKVTDYGKEKAQLAGKHCGSVIPDKPSLNKSNVLLQGASAQASSMNTSVLGSFSKVDIPVRTGHHTILDPDSDFKVIPTFVTENNVIKSLTGSYAKLPTPEPSLSPKMHRRHSRPSSACHILINNPINACELSPKGKEQTIDLVVQDTEEKTQIPETVPKLPVDLGVCSSKVYVTKNTSEAIQEVVLGKSNQVCQSSGNRLENKVIHGLDVMEGHLTCDGRGPHKMDSICTAMPRSHEPYATGQCVVSQNFGPMSALKSANVLEKNSCNLQMELNKSYDVKNPSPLLMQNQNTRQQMDTPTVSCGNEQFLDNSFEKVKRRLDLDIDSLQKENCPFVLTTGITEQEKQHLPEKRYPKGSVYINKNKMLESSSKEGEEILKSKMLAFEEMRKRLEEQHAQQLSLLIAEQEREQERLQKEIEEQEKMLKEKKAAEASELGIHSAVDLEWRKVSDSGLLETMLSQVDSLHTSNSNSSGFTNSALQHSFGSANEAPFYLWGSSTSGFTKLSVTRAFGRAKTKWSQVFSPEVQTKFNKVTAVAKGFLTRRLMQTDKLKQLRQTVKDTMEFIRSFQSEAPLKRGVVSAQDASLQERVLAQLRAALYGIHDIFFVMDAAERMSILHHDREVRKEKMLRQMDRMKSPRVALSAATQKSLDRKKYMKAAEMGMPNKKFLVKQNLSETRVLQPNQGQNAPVHRLLSRQGTPKTSVKGVVQNRQKSSQSRVPNRAPVSGAYAGKTQRKRPNVATI